MSKMLGVDREIIYFLKAVYKDKKEHNLKKCLVLGIFYLQE